MKRILLILFTISLSWVAIAHIGSPAVTFEGKAGNYAVLVLVTPPEVIPGTATVDIYTNVSGIESVVGKPVYWFAGDEGTPSADELVAVEGEPGHYRGLIWLMNSGTSGIDIEVKGEQGSGTVLVPVMAVSTAQNTMPPSLGWMLVGLCMLLVVLMITIISASVSDGLVKANEDTSKVKHKRWIGASVSAIVLLLILWGGKTWWDGLSLDYKQFMYKPLSAVSTVFSRGGQKNMEFKIDTTRLSSLYNTRRLSYIIPDHGKLMHMFMVRAGSMDVFAHLHPRRVDSATFVTPLPALLPGKYLVFADITRLSGFAETIADTIEIVEDKLPIAFASMDSSSLNRDDTFFVTNPINPSSGSSITTDNIVVCGKPGVKTTLQDGSTATWEHAPTTSLTSGKLYELTFAINDEQGKPATLEPYLGMMGHAVVMKTDGSVYIHLHPVGNYSMASQQTMITRFEKETGPVNWKAIMKSSAFMDSIDNVMTKLEAMPDEERNKILMGNMVHTQSDSTHSEHTLVKFPYAFPSSGNYRIWIQMKRNGKILNSAFDAVVE